MGLPALSSSQGKRSNCDSEHRIRRRADDADIGVGDVRVLEPREVVVDQRLAEPVVVEARQPLRLREEIVDAGVGFDRDRLVVVRALEADAGELVLIFVPFVLVILFEERAVAEPADFGLHGPVVEQAADEVLAVVPERAAAERFFGHDVRGGRGRGYRGRCR